MKILREVLPLSIAILFTAMSSQRACTGEDPICYQSVTKSCPATAPITCASTPCVYAWTNDCANVINGIMSVTYNCPVSTKEVRIKTMSGNLDCTTTAVNGNYQTRGVNTAIQCGEDRFCKATCTQTTEPDGGLRYGPNAACTFYILKAHCDSDSEGLWTDLAGFASYTYVPCNDGGCGCK